MDSCQVTTNHNTEDDDNDKSRGSETNNVSMTEETAEEEEDGNSNLNEDLLCEHGKFRLTCCYISTSYFRNCVP